MFLKFLTHILNSRLVWLTCLLILGSTSHAWAFKDVNLSYFKNLHDRNMNQTSEKSGIFGLPNARSDISRPAQSLRFQFDMTPSTIHPYKTGAGLGSAQGTDSVLFQANYDFPETTYGVPFVNAGLSVLSNHSEQTYMSRLDTSEQTRNDVILEAGGGLQIPLDEDVSLTGGYRYLDMTDTEFEAAGLDYRSHEFRFGFSFKLTPERLK